MPNRSTLPNRGAPPFFPLGQQHDDGCSPPEMLIAQHRGDENVDEILASS